MGLSACALLACGASADGASGGAGDAGSNARSGGGVVGSDGGTEAPDASGGSADAAVDGSGPTPAPDGDASSGSAPARLAATFVTKDTGQYLTVGAGGALVASGGSVASARPAETFALIDDNGGALVSGDVVFLANGGGRYLSVSSGGALVFSASVPGASETFRIVRVAGAGTIASGDDVAFEVPSTSQYVSAIDGGGGQVLANAPWDRAWETFMIGLAGVAGTDAGSPSADARQKVIATLGQMSGKHTAIGVEDKDATHPTSDSDTMASMANDGKQPSFWSADWGFGAGAVAARATIEKEAEAQWKQGAIVQFIYHACPPSWGSDETCQWSDVDGSSLSAQDWTDLVTPGGKLNQVWLARLDVLATFFQQLKDAGVAPLFRVLHEINDNWVWWAGHPGSTGSAELYRITHDYLVHQKGLDNIVWVWNLKDIPSLPGDVTSYAPGPSYFDVAALDVYDQGCSDSNYQAMQQASLGKPIGIAECEALPDPATLAAQPLWTYAVLWPDFFSQDTTLIPQLFGDPTILTLSDMPGWK